MTVTRRSVFRLAGLGAAAMLANCLPKRALALAKRPVDLTGAPRVKIVAGSLAFRCMGTGGRGNWVVHHTPDGHVLPGAACQIVDPSTGKYVKLVQTCDTGTGELRVYVQVPRKGLRSFGLGQYQPYASTMDTRVEKRDFDVVHRRTGEVLHRVRWV